ncbi:MAG: hypothetical protein ACXVC6_07255 [Bacteroidia bacterium]
MSLTNNPAKFFYFTVVILALAACKKPAGPGGKASIKGKIYVKDFNTAAYGPPISEYYGAGETVYICYGNNTTVGNTVKTSTDGSFEFLYLRKGHYKIFALSRDTSIHVAGSNKTFPVEVNVDISSTRQTINVPDITINQ